MPNWVFNNITIQDHSADTISAIQSQLNIPFERTFNDYWDRETQTHTSKTIQYSNPVFSFWNIHKPTDLEAYTSNTDLDKMNPLSGNDWYAFNNREWGTKWDVAVADGDEYPDTELVEHMSKDQDHWLAYRFNTAWSPPVEAIRKLSSQYPSAVITLTYQEEQGWGGEIEFVAGEITAESDYESQCRDCDEENCMEYCENDCGEICSSCNYLGEADLDAVAECDTHKIYLETNVPDYRKVQA